jgi:hypothetical protein
MISVLNDTMGPVVFDHSNNSSATDTIHVMLTLIGEGLNCIDTVRKQILVYPEVTADFQVDYTADTYPVMASMENLSANAGTYVWDFGDGNGSDEENPEHEYRAETDTIYNIILRAFSEYCSDSSLQQLAVYPPLSNSSISMTNDDPARIYYDYLNSEVVIEVPGEGGLLKSVLIFDYLGRLIQRETFGEYMDGDTIERVRLSGSESGSVCFVLVQVEEGFYRQTLYVP